jgi:catechol 2,3-dioxygenase-like lactoylglutathione lyase family enzyme
MDKVHGIQHIGVAVSDMERTLPLYRKWFGLNIPFFDGIQAAPLMQVFTNDTVISKRASMVMNLQGGSAMEVIQATSFKPRPLPSDFMLGDLGIFAVHMRTHEPHLALNSFENNPLKPSISEDPLGKQRFVIQDLDQLFYIALEDHQVYSPRGTLLGGVGGLSIGVSDIEKSKHFYALLGFDQVLYEGQANYDDLKGFPGGEQEVQRVILTTSQMAKGPFGAVIGYSLIELICTPMRVGQKIFRGRIWGDVGFVHIGLDVFDIRGLAEGLAQKNIQLQCDSHAALSMGKTQVHCAYVVDPDGILIELIEVYKIPLIEKWGIFLNVHGKKAGKALPNWLIRLLRFSRIKD